MNKETTHRSYELKAIGWNSEDISRYEELWEYSQRWGLINLEREDRQFLKKAEKLIPKLQPKKNSNKKSIEEKSYYLWLNFYLEKINKFNDSNLPSEMISVWEILIKEEIQILKKHSPTMGLPDTLKAKDLYKVRKELLQKSFINFKATNSKKLFDFDLVENSTNLEISKSWKSLIENDPEQKDSFPLINKKDAEQFKNDVNSDIEKFMIDNYPSLKDNL